MLQNLLSQAFEATTFHAVPRLRSLNFVAKLYIIIPTTDVQLKIILKRSCKKKKREILLIFTEIVENSQLIKDFFSVPTIGLLLEITAQGIYCILFPQLLKFFLIHFEATEPCFLEYINIWRTSTHSNGRYSMHLLNISCKE
jgi:hypothetical protein